MFYGDHPPPHFHAVYGSDVVKIAIDNLSVIDGQLPPRAMTLTLEWALHQAELLAAFDKAANLQPPGKIAPLV